MEQENKTFLNRVKISIKDVDKYHVFAADKIGNSIIYILKLVAVVMFVVSIFYTYKFHVEINSVDSYAEFFKDYDVPEEIKEEAVYLLENTEDYKILPTYFITNYILNFSIYSIITILDVVLLLFLGYISTMFSRIRFKSNVLFNISSSAITLSVILKGTYLIINVLNGFTIQYFDIMYTSVAYIYMLAAIMIIKTDFIKNEQELMEIVAEQEKIRKEFEEKERIEKEKIEENNKKEDK